MIMMDEVKEKGMRKDYEITYVASMTTPTPVGCKASVIATAICLVNLSWTVDKMTQT